MSTGFPTQGESAIECLGYQREEVIGAMNIEDILSPDSRGELVSPSRSWAFRVLRKMCKSSFLAGSITVFNDSLIPCFRISASRLQHQDSEKFRAEMRRKAEQAYRAGSTIVISPSTISPVKVNSGPKMAWFTGASSGSKNTVKAKVSPASPPPGPPSTASIL